MFFLRAVAGSIGQIGCPPRPPICPRLSSRRSRPGRRASALTTNCELRPTWILLPHTPDYRWLLDRDDSPWYPTARLFRQDGAATIQA